MSKEEKITLVEVSEEVVKIVNNEPTDYDANERVLEYLTHTVQLNEESDTTTNCGVV